MAHDDTTTSDHAAIDHGHIASMRALLGTFGALVVLTVVTVAAAYVDLGDLGLPVAMAIATVKATLVALSFMGLVHDRGFNRLIFFGSFLFVGLFVGVTLMDSNQYQNQLEWNEKVLEKR